MKGWENLPRTQLRLWHCGDDVCNCWQPVLERLTPNEKAGPPWINREHIWEGTFHSDPGGEEWLEMQREFDAAKEKYKPDEVQDVEW